VPKGESQEIAVDRSGFLEERTKTERRSVHADL
jgi:hypothetical protein